jgi:hypothetical protein
MDQCGKMDQKIANVSVEKLFALAGILAVCLLRVNMLVQRMNA